MTRAGRITSDSNWHLTTAEERENKKKEDEERKQRGTAP